MRFRWSYPLCAAAAVTIGASPASGATVGATQTFAEIQAPGGERNTMTVSARNDALVVRDRTARLRARQGCEQAGRHRVRCDGAINSIDIDLGRRADVLRFAVARGGPFADILVDGGGGGDDVRLGSGGMIREAGLRGGPGDDVLAGRGEPDFLDGGRGDDVLHGGPGADRLFGSRQFAPDRIDPGRDRLFGGAGADLFEDGDSRGRVGRDVVVGGTGNDRVNSYQDRGTDLVVDLSDRGGDGQDGENDRLRNVENVIGGFGDDRITGDGDHNRLAGRGGDDTVRGRGGRDRIVADGRDRVTGDLGDDVISISSMDRPRFDCGRGSDTLLMNLLGPAPRDPVAGRLVPPGCEWMRGRRLRESLTISSHPVATTPSGRLTFALTAFECCEHTLTLTRPERPFEELDSASVDNRRVRVDSGGGHDVLRVSTFDAGGEPLVWRFEVGR